MPDVAEPIGRLVEWAEREESVRAVVLTGSRAGTGASPDALSDYDVVLFVGEGSTLADDDAWLGRFGRVLVMLPERARHGDRTVPSRLVQYRDGLRIDFTLSPADVLRRVAGPDRLPDWLDAGYRVLVDKDGLAGALPPPSGKAHVPARPAEAEYLRVVREFWWESIYVAKGLARGEPFVARYSGECVLRFACLVPMLGWYAQVGRGWSLPLGPHGRGLAGLLGPEDRATLEATFAGAGTDESWEALFAAAALFRRAARRVADDLGYAYPLALDRDVEAYLRRIRSRGPDGVRRPDPEGDGRLGGDA